MMTQVHFFLLLLPHKAALGTDFLLHSPDHKLRSHLKGSVLIPDLSLSLWPCTAEC